MYISRYLETPRLILRPLLARDVLFFYRLVGNKEVRRFLGGPVPWKQRIPRFRSYLRSPADVSIWIVQTRQYSKSVGLIDLSPHKDGEEYEISYQFHPDGWGNGFAREATACVVQHSLTGSRLDRIIAETQSANLASCRLLEHLKMVELKRLQRFGAEQVIFAIQSSGTHSSHSGDESR
ncbi:GNAT family N-acetyltransferase [Octadecabacter algicola]|uniref:GNAT family N-acetyltransferase n=1 Tax=Octadecabacter algicola TaxID=2909342 RepID=UPI003AB96D2F